MIVGNRPKAVVWVETANPHTIKKPRMKFNIYGRFQVEVRRENLTWTVYRAEVGKRAKMSDVVIPADLRAREIATYLDDMFHEFAGIRQCVELIQKRSNQPRNRN
jgi:hypothetical protein